MFNGKKFGDDLTAWQKDYLKSQEQSATVAKFTVAIALSPSATFVKGVSTSVKATITTKFDGANVDVQTLTGSGKLAGFSGFALRKKPWAYILLH